MHAAIAPQSSAALIYLLMNSLAFINHNHTPLSYTHAAQKSIVTPQSSKNAHAFATKMQKLPEAMPRAK